MEEAGPSRVSHTCSPIVPRLHFDRGPGPQGPQRTATLEPCLRLGDRAGPGALRYRCVQQRRRFGCVLWPSECCGVTASPLNSTNRCVVAVPRCAICRRTAPTSIRSRKMFSTLKSLLRKASARTVDRLWKVIGASLSDSSACE